MQRTIEIKASDGHELQAYRADPKSVAKGGVIILHAVYGRTTHMGDLCAQWAGAGFIAIAPALYDRFERGTVFEYTTEGAAIGLETYLRLTERQILADISACMEDIGENMPKIISGFCTGGTWAWVAAARLPFQAQVNFYASQILDWLHVSPNCPTIIHYGDNDHVVSMEGVEKVRAAQPQIDLHVYPGAGHAFLNPEQSRYDKQAAALAWQRSLAFLDTNLSGAS